jgi:putative integral membrane protein (TIGR02587 family)
VLLLAYNRFAGFRYDAGWAEVAIDSVEELGLGLVTSAGLLFLLGRIDADTSLEEAFGKIVVEAVVVAIGFSVGTAQLGVVGDDGERKDQKTEAAAAAPVGQLVIAFCGAVLFAANVAPTEEILIIGVETDPLRLIGLVVLSLALGALILFFIDFRQTHVIDVGGHFDVVLGSLVTYSIAFVASGLILWFFGRFEEHALDVAIAQTVVLAFPATLGASAGRVLIQ